jgi:hypothetical protein
MEIRSENINSKNLPESRSSGLFLTVSKNIYVLICGGNREKAFDDIWTLHFDSKDEQNNSIIKCAKWTKKTDIKKSNIFNYSARFGLVGVPIRYENNEKIDIYLHGGQNHFTGQFHADLYVLRLKRNEINSFTIENNSNINQSLSSESLEDKLKDLEIKDYTCYDFKNLISQPIDTSKVPCERNSHSIAYDNKNSIYIFGGGNSSGLLNDLWQYNIEKNTFNKLNLDDTKIQQREVNGMVYYKENLYIFGGRLYDSIDNKLYKINLSTLKIDDNFTTLPSSLCCFSYCLFKHYIIIYGGTDGINFLNNIYLYNIKNNKWAKSKLNIGKSDINSIFEGKISAQMCIDEDSNLLLIFGGSSIHQDSNELFSIDLQQLLNENNLIQVLNN